MSIHYAEIDIFTSRCHALVNPVNCVGVMGRGLALAFKQRYPDHFASYRAACIHGHVYPGTILVNDLGLGALPRYLIAVPTKRHFRDRSELADIELSTRALARELIVRRIPSVAIPKLGCGLGGLRWTDVHAAIVPILSVAAARGCHVVILSPPP